MVLLQLLSADKKKKKLLSVDKDALFGDVHDQIAQKLEIMTLDGFVVSQIDDRDGDPVEDMLPDTKLSSLPRLGGAHYLWVREADEDTPPESIVGAVQDDDDDAPSSQPAPEPAPVAQAESEDDEPEDNEPEKDDEPLMQMPENNEGKAKKKPPPKSPAPPSPSPSPDTQQQTMVLPTPARHQMKTAVSTESYEPQFGKYGDFSKYVDSKKYPIQYANVRKKAPRVTTLSSDNSDNKAPDCLRESYNWTAVGRYKAMTDSSGKVGKSRQGTFKPPATYPRFASDSNEILLKKLFEEQMRLREKNKVQKTPKAERTPAEKKALVDALRADEGTA